MALRAAGPNFRVFMARILIWYDYEFLFLKTGELISRGGTVIIIIQNIKLLILLIIQYAFTRGAVSDT